MSKILITGVRAPGSLEWIRALSKHNDVYALDFIKFPIGGFSNGIKKYFKIPAPSQPQYEETFEGILNKHKFDLVIPTCEEIFHIYSICSSTNTPILANEQIFKVHSKLDFNKMAFDGWSGNMPYTEYKNSATIEEKDFANNVFKPEYTRFGTEVFVRPQNKDFLMKKNFWLQQQCIDGQEICVYTLCKNGNVIEHSFYKPENRAGKASTYFNWVEDERLLLCVKEFIAYYKLTGQISFDVIKAEDGYYFLECNPRMTSGIHNIPHNNLNAYIQEYLGKEWTNKKDVKTYIPKMLSFLNIGKPGWFKGKDVIYHPQDLKPFFMQGVSTLEMVIKSYKHNLDLVDATVYDICYPNGSA